jgi:hypothetical protein
MQGTITPTQPLDNLLWTLERFTFDAVFQRLTLSVNLYLSTQDRDNRKVLCTRQYSIPLERTPIIAQGEALVGQVLAAAVSADGQFTLAVG